MICDFCSSPAPAWRYPAISFCDSFGGRSVEDWLACEESVTRATTLPEDRSRPHLALSFRSAAVCLPARCCCFYFPFFTPSLVPAGGETGPGIGAELGFASSVAAIALMWSK
jgi:hypothetical protein